ncbi:TonB-dependent receptor [Sphingomonas hankyongi]|uniref:TonB-dependent receptor n=1 Tax=Sphingomonas hankyongi TaxID=2908209 RepID=UPI0024C1685E|nr:TonB-dependent receptor [Sphingomonas hankyongi]
MTSKSFLLAAVAAFALHVTPARAADAAEAAEASEPVPGDAATAHPDEDQAIVITGSKRPAGDVLGGVSVVDTAELAHDLKPSLGDTLADLPGVTSSSFGPSSSRPILRGLSGEDAPILIDGLTSLDLSSSDPDHAVSINPLTAERIEVLRGPGALLYNSSVIGGVVNVIDDRIPRHVGDHVAADLLLNYGSAADERSGNLGVDAPIGGHFVLHADGAYSKYDDLHVGGYLLSKDLREQALASPDPDIRALADLKDKLPNTAGRSDDAAAGVAYVDGDLNLGVSFSHHDARYGVPIRFSLDPAIVPEAPTIDAHQNRGDLRANVPIGGFFKIFEFRGGLSRYHHAEIEPNGAVGSKFYSDGGELRADVVQSERGGWGGTSGIQYLNQDFKIRGDEKYLPDSDNRRIGVFTLQTIENGPLRIEAGARIEFSRLQADEDLGLGTPQESRSFTPVSASAGANYNLVSDWRIGLSLSHSERAPTVNELFSNGPHGGSQQFLVGDPDLGLQKSNGAELSIHRTRGPVHVQANVYYNRYSNYIFEAPTGVIEDGLPIYEYRQGKADYYGFEVESDLKLGQALGIDWGGEITADAVRAKIRDFGDAPEIPPFRVLAGLTGTRGQVDGRIEVERASPQHRTAPEETPTAGYTMVNASLDWHPFAANPELTLSLTGNNLFDVEARRHSSELKDYAPLAGRDIRLSARIAF